MPIHNIREHDIFKTQPGQGSAIRYNPQMWNDNELKSIFVARNHELEQLSGLLARTGPEEVPQHILITGHRGMGKSTLMRRLAIEIKDNNELSSRWLPLTFPEEQYTVSTLFEFWRNTIDSLIDCLELMQTPESQILRLEHEAEALEHLEPEKKEEAALALLKNCMREYGKGLVLLVDGTDQLFSALANADPGKDKDANATVLWRLRKTLSHEPGFFWIGSSYHALETENQYRDAFHDFFSLIELRPLSVEAMRQALLALAETFGMGPDLHGGEARQRMREDLDRHPERLKALRTLTGGNPRTTVMLYDLFAASGKSDLRNDLNSLLDTMTPLYQSRMDNLSAQARKIFAHLMEAWAPKTAAQLSRAADLPTNAVSAQLVRLENWGYAEKTATSGKKRVLYQASERLFNIWYLMRLAPRRLRQRFSWLIEFMRLWYSAEELTEIAQTRLSWHGDIVHNNLNALEYSRAIAWAMPETSPDRARLEMQIFSVANNLENETRQNIKKIIFDFDSADDRPFATADDYLRRFNALDEQLRQCKHIAADTMQEWVEAVKGSFSLSLQEKEFIAREAQKFSETEVTELLRKITEVNSYWQKVLGMKAFTALEIAVRHGDFFPDCPDSELTYKQVFSGFDTCWEYLLATINLWQRQHQDIWLEKAYKQLLQLKRRDDRIWNDYGKLLHQLGRYKEAETAYRKAIAINNNSAYTWNNLGFLLANKLKRYQEAEEAYCRAISIDNKYGYAWIFLGNLLAEKLERPVEAEEAYRQAVAIDNKYGYAWIVLGNLLAKKLERYAEAEEAYRQAVAIDNKYAYAWHRLGDLLTEKPERYAEAEEAYRQAIAIDNKDAYAWCQLGDLLAEKPERYAEAEEAYRQAIAIDNKDAYVWYRLGDLLAEKLKRYDEAEKVYQQAINLDKADPWPHYGLAHLLAKIERRNDATKYYKQVIDLTQNDIKLPILKLQAHLYMGNHTEALSTLNELVAQATTDDRNILLHFEEALREYQEIGLCDALADLMEASEYADFLKPLSLALKALDNQDVFKEAPQEIAEMAKEIYERLLKPRS